MESRKTNDLRDPVSCFKDYEDYLDSKVTPMDLFFLKNKKSARKLVEHGHKGTVLSLQEFEQRKAASPSATRHHQNQTTTLASSGCDVQDNFLRALAEREEANRMGKMTFLSFSFPIFCPFSFSSPVSLLFCTFPIPYFFFFCLYAPLFFLFCHFLLPSYLCHFLLPYFVLFLLPHFCLFPSFPMFRLSFFFF
ncbi:cilia- and flagella-associated protein 299 isoform X4 [Phyllopteryx taeniolatus]|uniref:cilia- and flagella-associated protein 299 isoform X4 n=1 Tax=Phyllopteryx taeniolatus TaxID=161469 RepID=UPI002AD34960|nr:cilia- and flagella-associated protein 299 isoform X4 [Phyllopteryx taeniolatus]